MHQIIALLDAHAYSPIIWGLFVQQVSFPEQGKESNITIMEDALNKTAVCLAALTDLIGPNTYFASNELTLADLHAFPILHHLSLTTQGSGLMAESIYFRSWTERMRKNTSASHMFTRSPYNPSWHQLSRSRCSQSPLVSIRALSANKINVITISTVVFATEGADTRNCIFLSKR